MKDISECIGFWSRLSEVHRRHLTEKTIYRSYAKGENVLFKSVKKDGIIFVLSGGLRVYLASDSGREMTLFHLNRGDAFSIMTVDNATDCDVVPALQADSETKLAYLQRSDIAVVAYEERLMADFVFDTCAKTAQCILNNISFFVFNNLRKCVSREIVLKSKMLGSDTVSITHEEIANSLGSTRVVVSREIENLRNDGLISTGRGRIAILDRDGLTTLAGL